MHWILLWRLYRRLHIEESSVSLPTRFDSSPSCLSSFFWRLLDSCKGMMESPKFPPKDLESLCFHSLCDKLIWISLWHSRLDGVLIMGLLVFSSLARIMTFACWHQLSLLFLVYFLKNWNRNPDASEIGAPNANSSVFLHPLVQVMLQSCAPAFRQWDVMYMGGSSVWSKGQLVIERNLWWTSQVVIEEICVGPLTVDMAHNLCIGYLDWSAEIPDQPWST